MGWRASDGELAAVPVRAWRPRRRRTGAGFLRREVWPGERSVDVRAGAERRTTRRGGLQFRVRYPCTLRGCPPADLAGAGRQENRYPRWLAPSLLQPGEEYRLAGDPGRRGRRSRFES